MASEKCRKFYFGFLFFIELVDFVNDWIIFIEFKVLKKGLVYGPPSEAAVWALLVFACIGSVFFVFEAWNLWRKMFTDKKALNTTVVSTVVLWFEDVPQAILNAHIAYCVEDPVNIVQCIKAAFTFADVIIHIILAIWECGCCCRSKGKEFPTWKKIVVGIISVGMSITAICAGLVFVFTQTHWTHDGDLSVPEPQSWAEDSYNDNKYFQDVDVFMSLPKPDGSGPNAARPETQWTRLMSINDIRHGNNRDFNLIFEQTTTHFKLAFYYKNKTKDDHANVWDPAGCYQVDLTTGYTDSVNRSTCLDAGFFSNTSTSLFIVFSFIPGNAGLFKERIFGDIEFNVMELKNGLCTEYRPPVDIRYYRHHANTSSGGYNNLLMELGSPRFYNRSDLQDISEVWKTGWGECDCSGNLAPTLNSGVSVSC